MAVHLNQYVNKYKQNYMCPSNLRQKNNSETDSTYRHKHASTLNTQYKKHTSRQIQSSYSYTCKVRATLALAIDNVGWAMCIQLKAILRVARNVAARVLIE